MRLTLMAAAIMLVSAQANAGLEQQLTACAATADKLDRLICYDNVSANIKSASVPSAGAASQTVATSAATVAVATPVAVAATATSTAEEGFGLENKRKQENTVDKIYLEVASVDQDPYGDLKVTFTNGQQWKQTESRSYKVTAGETVFIEKGALGSFFLGTDGRNSKIRVKRIQ